MPQIFAVTPDKRVVWFLDAVERVGPVSFVQVVDSAATLGASALR